MSKRGAQRGLTEEEIDEILRDHFRSRHGQQAMESGAQRGQDRSRSPVRKWNRQSELGEGSAANSFALTGLTGGSEGSSGAAGGAAGNPLPLLADQNQRAIDGYRLKFGGTTWVKPSSDGTAPNNNLWSIFPWEFYQLFIQKEQVNEIVASHMYWRAKKIKVEFKNPLCVQAIQTTTDPLAAAGQNVQAQMFTYSDNMYMFAPTDRIGADTNNIPTGLSKADLTALVDSWDTAGYAGATPSFLPIFQVTNGSFSSGTPDVKSLGMGGGQAVTHSWNIHSPYWRSTTNLFDTTRDFDTNRPSMPRWDEWFGTIGYGVNGNNVAPAALPGWETQIPTANRNAQPQVTAAFETVYTPYRCPDPIPRLFLQLQPQLGSLGTGGQAASACQINFEMEVDLELTGRVPRQCTQIGYNNTVASVPQFGLNLTNRFGRPLFYPLINNDPYAN